MSRIYLPPGSDDEIIWTIPDYDNYNDVFIRLKVGNIELQKFSKNVTTGHSLLQRVDSQTAISYLAIPADAPRGTIEYEVEVTETNTNYPDNIKNSKGRADSLITIQEPWQ